jgi:hypothetical protein
VVGELGRQLRIVSMGLSMMLVIILAGCFADCVCEAYVWEDVNCNGKAEVDEPPMEGVCVWSTSNVDAPPLSAEECADGFLTDSRGELFCSWFPGCACERYYFFIRVPDGYQPTTYTVVNGCSARFGLASESSCPKQPGLTPAQQIARQRTSQTLTKVAWCVGPTLLIGVVIALATRFWPGPGQGREQGVTAPDSKAEG